MKRRIDSSHYNSHQEKCQTLQNLEIVYYSKISKLHNVEYTYNACEIKFTIRDTYSYIQKSNV